MFQLFQMTRGARPGPRGRGAQPLGQSAYMARLPAYMKRLLGYAHINGLYAVVWKFGRCPWPWAKSLRKDQYTSVHKTMLASIGLDHLTEEGLRAAMAPYISQGLFTEFLGEWNVTYTKTIEASEKLQQELDVLQGPNSPYLKEGISAAEVIKIYYDITKKYAVPREEIPVKTEFPLNLQLCTRPDLSRFYGLGVKGEDGVVRYEIEYQFYASLVMTASGRRAHGKTLDPNSSAGGFQIVYKGAPLNHNIPWVNDLKVVDMSTLATKKKRKWEKVVLTKELAIEFCAKTQLILDDMCRIYKVSAEETDAGKDLVHKFLNLVLEYEAKAQKEWEEKGLSADGRKLSKQSNEPKSSRKGKGGL